MRVLVTGATDWPRREKEFPHPISHYGRSKRAAPAAAAQLLWCTAKSRFRWYWPSTSARR